MQFLVMIYTDDALVGALAPGEADAMMRECLAHADQLRRDGRLLDSQMLAGPQAARTVRIRGSRVAALDGPFAETKEILGGFNLIEARDLDEAVAIASEFPWARVGSVEVRPVQPIDEVRARVGAPPAMAAS